MMSRYGYDDDEDRQMPSASGTYKVPDRDFYRKNFNTFSSVYLHFQNKMYVRRFEDRRLLQPHFSALANVQTPYGNLSNPADGVCCHFLRRGFTKPNKVQFNTAIWSPDARWLVLGTQTGDLALWEGEALKVHKVMSVPAHKEFHGDGNRIKEQFPITAMAWKHHGNILVSGDSRGLIQYCDEAFHNVVVTKEAHGGAVRGLSYSPLDSKLVSCGDDGRLHLWAAGRDKPEQVLLGHQSDVKCVDWHPQRALIASGSRDSSIRLWDPKVGKSICTISSHKKQVNCCQWNANGNWLASGSMDGLIKLYDIRTMKELEVWRGQNSEVCSMAWHPIHETLMLSGGYNGSLIYWIAGQNQMPHSMIADAHRQSVDVIAWHPAGHLLSTASHDCILKFWCREPPGSKLELPPGDANQEFPPIYLQGPIESGTPSVIHSKYVPGSGTYSGAGTGGGGGGFGGGGPGGAGGYNNSFGGGGMSGQGYRGGDRGNPSGGGYHGPGGGGGYVPPGGGFHPGGHHAGRFNNHPNAGGGFHSGGGGGGFNNSGFNNSGFNNPHQGGGSWGGQAGAFPQGDHAMSGKKRFRDA